jgi:hypothetical protein
MDAKKAGGPGASVEGGGDVFSVTTSNSSDVDYLGESTKGDLNVKREHLKDFGEFL